MKKQNGFIGIAVSGLLVVLVLGFIIGSILWPYTLNTWLGFFGQPQVVKWWQGGLLGFVPGIGQLSIPAAVLTWIAMLFL